MSTYRFKEPAARQMAGPLPEGDYNFRVTNADEPYESKAGNQVLPLELEIEEHKIFANPWAGYTKAGEERDGIAEFLLAVNRAPKAGQEPDWKRLVGAKGRCRLKVEIASQGTLEGKPVNKVAYFHAPRQVDKDYHAAQAEVKSKAANPKAGEEPDDIPF